MTSQALTNSELAEAGLGVVDEALEDPGVDNEPIGVLLALRSRTMQIEERAKEQRIQIEQAIAKAMSADSQMVDGIGLVKRSHRKSKHALPDATEMLVRDVLDSRLVNPETGEITDETPVEKLTAVFGLSVHNARTTQLKARGLNERDYAEVRYADEWTVQVVS